jgi:kynurenine 3-monooxygenase
MKATIIGGGLVGSLWAIFLARRGIEAEIFERRPDMRRADIPAGRSINLAVSTRGLHALEKVGLKDEILKHGVAMRGRMIHAEDGAQSLLRYGQDDSECIYSISRGTLNKALMTEAEKTGLVRIHFERQVTAVRFDDAVAHEAEVLFGTDGSASAVRQAISPNASNEKLSYGYKELTIAPEHSKGMDKHALHIWPRGSSAGVRYMLIALPNEDESYTCTLFLPFEGHSPSFATLSDAHSVRSFFDASFQDAVPRLPDLSEQFFAHPTGEMWTVKCQPWNIGGRSLLLGDAAHAIVPFFGQGMNCGFEDCSILDDSFAKGTQDLPTLFSAFSSMRKPNADAIADMAVENFVEMRDKVADPRFVFEKEVEKVLAREFPLDYVPRYGLVTFSRVPYRTAYEAGVRQQAILSELCNGIETPEQVDLVKAKKLITDKLTPLLRG